MSRWPPDAGARLKAAALRLFAEKGFAAVSGGEIAVEAGVSERTFFRHFKAKEDALFEDYAGVGESLIAVMAAAPADERPRDLMQRLADALSRHFAARRDEQLILCDVISREPSLRAREYLRDQAWTEAIAQGFASRGYPEERAKRLAATMASTFRLAYDQWLPGPEDASLAALFGQALTELAADLL